jgi:DNA-binding beta-propeller fold protein YncE/DNA-directed RNA polymerase subunit RPC12/RpoP
MPAAFRCPTCSAPLEPPPAHATSVRCPYCGAGVLLAEQAGRRRAAPAHEPDDGAIGDVLRHLRAGSKIGAIKVYRDRFGGGLKEAKEAVERLAAGQPAGTLPASVTATPQGCGGTAILVFAALMLAAIVGFYLLARGPQNTAAVSAPPIPGVPSAAAAGASSEPDEPPFAREVLRFGAEGTGAGRFEDARGVAVDGTGRIYVAEYSGGRVQVFDSTGAFLTQWTANARMPLMSMAADRDGTVYIVQSGRISRFEGATGRALGALPPGTGYEDVTVALDGSLWTVGSDKEIVHLDRDGSVRRTLDLEAPVDEDATPSRIAVSGTGDVYVLDQWKATVYRFGADGRFVDRFGSGEFPGADDVAVDGRGRVYVSGMGPALSVFTAGGEPVASFGGSGVVFGIAMDERDGLFATFRNDHEIRKFRLPR